MKANCMRVTVLIAGLLAAPVAWGHGLAGGGFHEGILHPLSGWDHVLAALGIGLWLSLYRLTPASGALFAGVSLLGVALVMTLGGPVAHVDGLLAALLILFGLLLVRTLKLPPMLAALLVAVVIAGHSLAHFAEMPAGVAVGAYTAGFLASTLLIAAVSAVSAGWISRRLSLLWLRFAGGALAVTGLVSLGLA